MGRPASFDRLARPYRWLEYLSFGPCLERCRFHTLDRLRGHRHALILGDGDGRFTARLMAANPDLRVVALDSSQAMLRLLRARVAALGHHASERLTTIHSDALVWAPRAAGFDLIATHFFLDCFTDQELATLTAKLGPLLTPGANWLVSEFAVPKRGPAASFGRVLIAGLYCAFRSLTGLRTRRLPDYATAIQQAGFTLRYGKTFLGGVLVTQLWQRDRAREN